MKRPELEDFGVTPEQYAQYKGVPKKEISILSQLVGWTISISVFVWFELGHGWLSAAAEPLFIVYIVSWIPITFGCFFWTMTSGGKSGDAGAAAALGTFWPLAIPLTIGLLVQKSVVQFKKRSFCKNPAASRIRFYEEAIVSYQAAREEAEAKRLQAEKLRQEAERQRREDERAKQAALLAEQRRREQYWKSLGGIEFEQELGKLYRARGYNVKSTPVSGDQGVDLILTKNGETTVVQCKAHKRPASPAVVRELYGSMHAFGADNAILACTGGFSVSVKDFARGKPIELISAREIARMARNNAGETIENQPELISFWDTEPVAKSNKGESQLTPKRPPLCPTPGCGRTMVLRDGRRGMFWGCPGYPTCRGTRNL